MGPTSTSGVAMPGARYTEEESAVVVAAVVAGRVAEYVAANPGRTLDGCLLHARRVMQQAGTTIGRRRNERVREMRAADGVPLGTQTVADPPTADDYDRFFGLLREADSLRADLAPTQESTEFAAPDDGLPVGVAFAGDWHLGASGVEWDRLDADLATIGATPGLYAVGMGDYVEGVTLTTKAASALFSGLFNGPELQDEAVRRTADRARGKWLAFVAGNHDEWVAKATGYGRTDRQARYLGAPFFSQGGGTIFATVGAHRYVIAVTHNAKGNSQLNTSNAQRRTFDAWPQWENCHVICCGHLHYLDLHHQTRKGGRCLYLRSGTAKTRDGYAADHGYRPEYGIPVAILYPNEERVIGFRGDDFDAAVRFLNAERARLRKTTGGRGGS